MIDKFPSIPFLPYSNIPHNPHNNRIEYINVNNTFKNNTVIVSPKMDGINVNIGERYSYILNEYKLYDLTNGDKKVIASIDKMLYYISNIIINALKKCEDYERYKLHVSGELMYLKNIIKYDNLSAYFFIHTLWTSNNHIINYNTTAEMLNKDLFKESQIPISLIPCIYSGVYNKEIIHNAWKKYEFFSKDISEGYVIKSNKLYSTSTITNGYLSHHGKYIRPNFNNDHFFCLTNRLKEYNYLNRYNLLC